MRTFSRKGRGEQFQQSPPAPTSAPETSPGRNNLFPAALTAGGLRSGEAVLRDPQDPFFFSDGEPKELPKELDSDQSRAGARAGSKGGSRCGGGSGRQAAQAAAAGQGASAAAGAAGAAARASGKLHKQNRAATATGSAGSAYSSKGADKALPKQRAPVKPTASLLSQRNPGVSSKQQQKQQSQAKQESTAAATEQKPASSRARPSVRSTPAAGAPAAAPEAAGQDGVAAAAAVADGSPGKRKAAAAKAEEGSPGKRMRRCEASQAVGKGAEGAAGGGLRAGGTTPGGGGGGAGRASGGSSGRLGAALNPAALRERSAATTVVQAQALGEQQSITDDALWALDGLASGSDATARDSLAALAEICATRRGRLALRSSQLAADVLTAAGSLPISKDPVQALGLATLLLCFCQADVDAALLGRQEVATAAAQLLKLSTSLDASSATAPAAGSAAAAKLAAVLSERPFSLQLPREERSSPLAVALAALADVLDPSKSTLHADPLKHALRQAGALEAAAQVAADHAGALSDASPTMQTVRSLWRLHKALHLLECACFACPENEARLLQATVSAGVPPMVSNPGFVGWLVQQLALMSRQPLMPGFKKDCLRALLAVLLNSTQNNQQGCAAVVAAGVLEPAAAVLAQLVRGGPKIKGVEAGEGELTAWHDVLSTCMALFTNLVEHETSWRQQLRQLQLPDPRPAAAGGGGRVQLVPLLCTLLTVVAVPAGSKPGETPKAAAGAAGLSRRVSLGSGEVTADCLALKEDRDTQSMAEVYAAVLLGFLIQDSAEAREQAAALLPGGSLDGVVAAVQHALDFYATMGAMTQDSVDNLRSLLVSLRQQPEVGGAAAAAAGAGGQGRPAADEDVALSPVLG